MANTVQRVRFLTTDEETALRAAIGEAEWPMVAVSIHTGLRQAEQFKLCWEHIDFATGIITLPRSKHGEARRVPMNDTVRDIFRSRPSRVKSAYVFPSATGETALDARNYMNRVFNKALKRAGIEDFTWHCLRHTFASRLVMKGVDLRTVQELLGHKTTAMTLRYSHLSPGHQLDAVQRLNAERTDTRTDTDARPAQAVAGSKAEIVGGPWTSERARPDSNGDLQVRSLMAGGAMVSCAANRPGSILAD
jgi:integrase